MALPSAWKVRRELERIRVKAVLFTSRWFHDPIRKPIYDLTARWRQLVTKGKLPLTDRVTVFVVYQPKGLTGSILITLEHLRRNNYSVLVVSNGPLQSEDRETLAAHSAAVMERPNVGYDFGAYRDGIRYLWSLNHDLSLLVLMNDSTWFPLRRDDDSLARMEALDADLSGHIFKMEERHKGLQDHIESHLLIISRKFVVSDDFRRFWLRYRMSDHRATTIRSGEKGFSQFAIRGGWTVKAMMGREWLVDCLQSRSDQELAQILEHTVDGFQIRMQNADAIRRTADRGEAWHRDYVVWAYQCLSNTTPFGLSSSFVMPAMVYGGLGFAKKGRDLPFHFARQKLLELEARGVIAPLDEVVRAEIAAAVGIWVSPKGQEGSIICPRPRR
ncbi:rhamnan synthesis F family protein [Tabrizicola sp.]|uniref:rhamnan synthesis F family protein n=1 Tax=Tabrizicola sp. TaxID=2005166 RepID=UPI0025EA2C20|nr:rhamnan synthesis F family protein [Tabrizicola sp.]